MKELDRLIVFRVFGLSQSFIWIVNHFWHSSNLQFQFENTKVGYVVFFLSFTHMHTFILRHACTIHKRTRRGRERERDPPHLDWTVFFFVQKMLFFSSKPSLPRPVYLSHFVYLPNSCSCFFINLSLTHRHTHTHKRMHTTNQIRVPQSFNARFSDYEKFQDHTRSSDIGCLKFLID